MRRLFVTFAGGAGGALALAVWLGLATGGIYWLFMAARIGSFLMFALGIFPITAIVTAPLGLWSFIFGMPIWLYRIFG